MAKVAQGVRQSKLAAIKATKNKKAANNKAKGATGCNKPSNQSPVKKGKGDPKAELLQMMDSLRDNCRASMEASADVFSANIKLFGKVLECQTAVKSKTVIDGAKHHKNKK
jgi:hypothetical protein